MKYTGSTPMPFLDISDDGFWHSMPVKCLDATIRNTIKNRWQSDVKFVMVKTERERITVLLNGVSNMSTLLYFE